LAYAYTHGMIKVMTREGWPTSIEIIPGDPLEAYEHFDDFEDKPQDECGVLAVYAPGEPVGELTYEALRRLQHRGQSGAGVAYMLEPGLMWGQKENGLIDNALPDLVPHPERPNMIDVSQSPLALGHTRYSTATSNRASQPFIRNSALGHNGHIELINQLGEQYGIGAGEAVSDSDMLSLIIDKRYTELGDMEAALHEVLPRLEGAYCLTITDGENIYGVRDPWGTHPLSLGILAGGKGYMLASETTAFKFVELKSLRDVEAGEIIKAGPDGVKSSFIAREEAAAHCMFEYIYIARPTSEVDGVYISQAREQMGRYLATDHPVEADVVVGVPNSGLFAADGYCQTSGIPEVRGLVKNDYEARTFIERSGKREDILRRKFDINRPELEGRRVVLVDDSVIKGSTMRFIVSMLREEGGASEVHVRSAAPRYKFACYGGMDTRETKRLIARDRTDEQIAAEIGADSIAFNSVERIRQAIEDSRPKTMTRKLGRLLCTGCATGEYPYQVPRDEELDLVAMATA
jgi:amidophosphoribosyltransferase